MIVGPLRGNPFDRYQSDETTAAAVAVRPMVAHVHGLWDASTCAAMRLLSRRDVPLVFSPRGMLEPWALNQRWFKKRLFLAAYLARILKRAELLHATSDEECCTLRGLGFRQPIAVIPNGIDVSAGSISGAWQTRPTSKRLLYLGRLHVKKGLENLLHAWARVRPDGWQLQIAGIDDGGYQAKLERLAAQLELHGDVAFPGPQIGVAKWEYLSSGSAFVHPSFSENFGIAVAEAMVAGLPVIATVGTPWKLLAEHRLGWWVEPTPEALASAIAEVIDARPATLADMGRRAQAYVAEHFAWSGIARKMADCYDWLCERGPVPDCIRP